MTHASPRPDALARALPRAARWPTAAPVLAGFGAAMPPHAHPQAEIGRAFTAALPAEAAARLSRLLDDARVACRAFSAPLERLAGVPNRAAAAALLDTRGSWLAAAALAAALRQARLTPVDVDTLLLVTAPTPAAAALDLAVAGHLGLRRDLQRLPLTALGPAGAIAACARAADLLRARPDRVVAVVALELTSARILAAGPDATPLSVLARGADGAAAAVLVGARRADRLGLAGPRLLASRAAHHPGTAFALTADLDADGHGLLEAAGLADLAHEHPASDVRAFLADLDLAADAPTAWLTHGGAPDLLAAFSASLELSDSALAGTRRTLADHGDVGAAGPLLTLADLLAAPVETRPAPGSLGLCFGLAPGLASEVVLLAF